MKRGLFVLISMTIFSGCSKDTWDMPVPVVTGPITGPGTIFCASSLDLDQYGFVEEEYFLEGEARRYEISSGLEDAIVVDSQIRYKTRLIVRRPVNSHDFNGTVVMEWLNDYAQFDNDSDWGQLYEHLLRSGYAWVGVSAQRAGIHSPAGLRNWNPDRYGTLDVTADSTLLSDELCYDIFSQAMSAVLGHGNKRVLGNLTPDVLIVSGHSDSSERLTVYYNSIQPVVGISEGFMLRGGGGKLRTDVEAKVFKINTETDLILLGMVGNRQPDSDRLVTWEISGSSHADQKFMDNMAATIRRDFGPYEFPECDRPAFSLIPFDYAHSAALDHLVRWIKQEVQPPPGIPMAIEQTEPVVVIARDSLGNALGGIRLPQHAVPVAMNTGINSGTGFCKYSGSHTYFDEPLLKALYPHHQDYMISFARSVAENLTAGYILQSDTSDMLDEARSLAAWWE